MKRMTHPEAYDWLIKCGRTKEEVEGAFDELVIGIYHAHADLRAAGKFPASAISHMETYNNNNEDHYMKFAIVNSGFMSIKLTVWGDEEYCPHFHFYKNVDINSEIPNEGRGGGCIMIQEAKYFIHGSHQDTMNSQEIQGLVEFLESSHPALEVPIWKYIIDLWNSNNPTSIQVDINSPIPPYKSDMPSINQKK